MNQHREKVNSKPCANQEGNVEKWSLIVVAQTI
jgi:hypothetical protein